MVMGQTADQEHELDARQEGSTFGNIHAFNSHVHQIGNIYARTVNIGINTSSNATAALNEGFSNIKLQRVATFVDRPFLHAKLKSQLHDTLYERTTRSRVLILHGLGGTGKTQLVLNYLQEYCKDYYGTFWVNAGQKQSVVQEFTQIYRFLFLSPTVPERELPIIEDVILRVKNWFNQGHQKWLWVFDSADSIEDPEDPEFFNISAFLPSSPSVDVIVTTRCRNARDITPLQAVEVTELEPNEALDLFWRTSKLLQAEAMLTQLEASKSIVKVLGYLALAVSLAGSYVSATPRMASNLALYLLEYQENRRILLSKKPNALVHQYGESVLTTWETSFAAMKRQSSLACGLLALFAFLDPEDIFLDLFIIALSADLEEDDEPDFSTLWQDIISPEAALSIRDIETAFALLESFSLIRWGQIQCSYSMHKLVHAWCYDRNGLADHLKFGISATLFLVIIIKHCNPEPSGKSRIVKHLMLSFATISTTLVQNSDEANEFSYLIYVFRLFASYLDEMGLWKEEIKIENFIVKHCFKILGEEDPSTISVMNNLASTLGNQGQLDQAASMKKEVLEKRRRILGEEHPSTISAMNNLAILNEMA